MTLIEIIVSLVIMAIIIAVIVPQFVTMRNSWDSKAGAAETIQNGRVLIDHLNRNLSKAVQITAVSDSAETDGFIEFEDNDGNTLRYDIAANNYVEFGVVGDLSDLAGPVSQLQFSCYDACDLNTPLSTPIDANTIRFVEAQTTLTNSATFGQDETLIASAYLRTNWNTSSGGGQVTYEEFTEAKRSYYGQDLDINTPAGTGEGDLLIAAVVTDAGETLSPPGGEGWTLIDQGVGSGAVTLGVWWKLADVSESGSHQFTWGSNEEAYGWIMRFTGHHSTTPINDSQAQGGGTDSTPPSPSVSTTVADTMILRIGGFDRGNVNVDNPGLSGHATITMDESSTSNFSCSGGAGWVQQAAIGASGSVNFSLTKSEEYRTVTIAIAPDPEGGGGGGGQILP